MSAIELYRRIRETSKLIKSDVSKDEIESVVIEKWETNITTIYTVIKREKESEVPLMVFYGYDIVTFKRSLDLGVGKKL